MNENISNILGKFLFKIKNIRKNRKDFEVLRFFFNKQIVNLTELNSLNFFRESNNHYLHILKTIEDLKTQFDLYLNKPITKSYVIMKLKKEILFTMNLVACKKITTNLCLINTDYKNKLSLSEMEMIKFIDDFIKISCLWISNVHPEENENTDNNKIIVIPAPNTPNNNFFKSIFINSIYNSSEDKTVNQETVTDTNSEDKIQLTQFTKMDIIKELDTNNILITKNKKAQSLFENKLGVSIYLKLDYQIIVFQGIFNDDLFNVSYEYKFIQNILADHTDYLARDTSIIPTNFKNNYFNIINLRDKIIMNSKDIMNEIKKKYNDFKYIQNKPIMLLINEFILGSKYRKIDILTLFLLSNEEDQKLAYILFDIFKMKDKKNIALELYNTLHPTIRKKLDIAKLKSDIEEKELFEVTDADLTYEKKIQLLKVDPHIKVKATEKLKLIKNSLQGDSKAQAWLDGLLKIPFNSYSENEIISFKRKFIDKLPIRLYSDIEIDNYFLNNEDELSNEWSQYKTNKRKYLKDVRKTLDDSVYGHKEAKLQLERIFAQWINGEEKGAVIGLLGPPGTGKTSLAKHGLSKCLKSKNGSPRPFSFLAIGGAVNGSTLIGHNYTYVGSTWGKIVDILITTKCMNPIIFIDELDKVSATENGREIISILTHLTDATQNDDFEDKFFSGIKLDISKALIVFSFNDINLIDPILKDRITIIETNPLSLNEKIEIVNNYMLPEVCKEIGFVKNEIIIEDKIIKYIIETYTLEAGVRKLKEKIVQLIREINLQRFYDDNICFPFIITKEFCEEIFELKPKIKVKKINTTPQVGIVNGLYANAAGLGGITTIQAIKFPSDKMFELSLTGSLGDVMKESINYSLKLALSLLPPELKLELMENSRNKQTFGIHLHCPEGGVKKDGPSAGCAITLALYSLLSDKPINNEIALTGEVDLVGNITAIGGLKYKLNGAKKAGVKLALYPKENQEDVDIILKEDKELCDNNFDVLPVSHISHVLAHALMKK